MATNRQPVRRPLQRHITSEALAAFLRMKELDRECTCPPRDWSRENYWKHKPCAACDAWWDQHRIVHQELKCRPWEWPCIERPGGVLARPALGA
jgi:hypothetical protein